jgi:mono/diheme cytochrome c family protein
MVSVRCFLRLSVIHMLVPLLACAACGKAESSVPGHEEQELFHNVCARCHGQDGTGGPPDSLGHPGPKNFTDPTFQKSMTDEQIKNTIINGNRGMPAFGAVLTPAQLDLLVHHVRGFDPATKGGTVPSASSRPLGGS